MTDTILTPNKFALIVENIVKDKKISYIDAILDYCTDNEIDPANARSMINKTLKEKIAYEAQNLNMLKGEGSKTTILNYEEKIRNNAIPHVNFRVRELGEWVDTNTDTYFKDKKVILFALPGAFTPTCSNQQLPGFDKHGRRFQRIRHR